MAIGDIIVDEEVEPPGGSSCYGVKGTVMEKSTVTKRRGYGIRLARRTEMRVYAQNQYFPPDRYREVRPSMQTYSLSHTRSSFLFHN